MFIYMYVFIYFGRTSPRAVLAPQPAHSRRLPVTDVACVAHQHTCS